MKKWTEEDKAFLKNNIDQLSTKQIAAHLNTTEGAVFGMKSILGISKPNFWSKEDQLYLERYYISKGAKEIAKYLGRQPSYISLRAKKANLIDGKSHSRFHKKRRRAWTFPGWSRALGYIVGVYLGDGSLEKRGDISYGFRLTVKDEDFARYTHKICLSLISPKSSIAYNTKTSMWKVTAYCVDFCAWLSSLCGSSYNKIVPKIDDKEAICGLLEGFYDSEGTVVNRLGIRAGACLTDFYRIREFALSLGVKEGKRHKGIRLLTGRQNRKNISMHTYFISTNNWNNAGLFSHIKRKADAAKIKFAD